MSLTGQTPEHPPPIFVVQRFAKNVSLDDHRRIRTEDNRLVLSPSRQTLAGPAEAGHYRCRVYRGRGYRGRGYRGRGCRWRGYRGRGYRNRGHRGRACRWRGYRGPGYRWRGYRGRGYRGPGYRWHGDQCLGWCGCCRRSRQDRCLRRRRLLRRQPPHVDRRRFVGANRFIDIRDDDLEGIAGRPQQLSAARRRGSQDEAHAQ